MSRHKVIFGLGVVSIGGFLANATGLFKSFLYELYLASLLVGLSIAGLLFGRVVASLPERQQSDQGTKEFDDDT